MSEKLLVITQARVGGTRFSGKMLRPLLGQPLILWHLARAARVQTPHTLIVACPPTPENTPLVELCQAHGYLCEQPPCEEQDLLARFTLIAQKYDATEVVRLCADTPTVDPQVIDALIAYHRWQQSPHPDHTGIGADWPDGCDCEVVTRTALEIAHTEAALPSDREHTTSYLYTHPERFTCATFPCPFPLRALQFSIDTPYDLTLVEQLLRHTLPRTGLHFGWEDLLTTLMLKPSLAQQIQGRPPRNGAYTLQVARERGTAVQSWEKIRYREGV